MGQEIMTLAVSDFSELIAGIARSSLRERLGFEPDVDFAEIGNTVTDEVLSVLEEASTYEARIRMPSSEASSRARTRASKKKLAEGEDGGTFVFGKHVQLPHALFILLMTTLFNVIVAKVGLYAPETPVGPWFTIPLAEALSDAAADTIRDYFYVPDLVPAPSLVGVLCGAVAA